MDKIFLFSLFSSFLLTENFNKRGKMEKISFHGYLHEKMKIKKEKEK